MTLAATTLTASVKALALELGFDLVTIGPCEPPEHGAAFRRWIEAGHAGTMGYLGRRLEERLDPQRVLPGARFYDLDLTNPIFHAFFEVKTLDVPQYYDPPPAIFRAVYEDNDPAKRIVVMINYNTDISEFWEWSDTGLKPIDESNEAYKLGVNYIVYGLTH